KEPAPRPSTQLKRCQRAALRGHIDQVMRHSRRGHNGSTGTVLPPEAREVWWRTGKAPDKEVDTHPAPGVRPAHTQRVCLNGPEPAILTTKQNQALSNGWGGADGL